MTFRSTIAGAAMLAAHQTAAQEHRYEADPVASVRENFVVCDVLSQLILASCWAANASRCAQAIGYASMQTEAPTSASIRTRQLQPANGLTRKRYRNEAHRAFASMRLSPSVMAHRNTGADLRRRIASNFVYLFRQLYGGRHFLASGVECFGRLRQVQFPRQIVDEQNNLRWKGCDFFHRAPLAQV